MKSVVDYFVSPSEFNKFLDSLKKHEIEAIVTEGSYSRPEEGKEFLEDVVQGTLDEMKVYDSKDASISYDDDWNSTANFKEPTEYGWEINNVEDMQKFTAVGYSFKDHHLTIENPISLVDAEDRHIVKAARTKGGTVYDTYHINKSWTYMVTYGEEK